MTLKSRTARKSYPVLKDCLGAEAVHHIADSLSKVMPDFDRSVFIKQSLSKLPELELKARVYHLINTLHNHLPTDFRHATEILVAVKQQQKIQPKPTITGFVAWPLIDYVAVYGLQHPKIALHTLAELTSLFSAEFAIRPFIEQHYSLTYTHLQQWCRHPDHHIRRLVSEGTRPRLPWGEQLPQFIKDPKPILPLLEKLKTDPKDYVRRSVANNLNDISKDHPQTVLATCKRWLKQPCQETQWIVRHATRTLVKKGMPEVFTLLGYTECPQLRVTLSLQSHQLQLGENLELQLKIISQAQQPQKLVIDYAIHFMKTNGQQQAKVFKLKSVTLAAGESLILNKIHRLVPLSTRRYYSGQHKVEAKVNGLNKADAEFKLKV
jgi:3-methyladenine DNA glycosylase AlkC